MRDIGIEKLLGKTIIKIDGMEEDSTEVIVITSDNKKYKMYHYQDCCESVYIDTVYGDIDNLLNSPILMAEEKTNSPQIKGEDSITWTFYTIATAKGFVDLRWWGSSNGYYSESVYFEEQ